MTSGKWPVCIAASAAQGAKCAQHRAEHGAFIRVGEGDLVNSRHCSSVRRRGAAHPNAGNKDAGLVCLGFYAIIWIAEEYGAS